MTEPTPTRDNVETFDVVKVDDKDTRLSVRNVIDALEASMLREFGTSEEQCERLNGDGRLQEWFVDGAYIRQLTIPADTAVVSRLWNRERLWVIIKGDVTITTELGRERIKAPYIALAPWGTKVALYAHEDTLWLAITGAKATNHEEVEEEVLVKDYDELIYPWDKLEHKGDK